MYAVMTTARQEPTKGINRKRAGLWLDVFPCIPGCGVTAAWRAPGRSGLRTGATTAAEEKSQYKCSSVAELTH